MHHAQIDKLACRDSLIHRLDSRVKLIGVFIFTFFVILVKPSSLSLLFCYAVWPFSLIVIGQIPFRFVIKQILILSPFIAVMALATAYYDRGPEKLILGNLAFETTLGVVKGSAIILKFIITMAALTCLMSTTRFNDLLSGLSRLKVPSILIMQLSFLYRYIFLLINRGHHILQARAGRKLGNLNFAVELKTAAAMIGSLFVGSIDSAQRISMAMEARGFDGRLRTLNRMKIRKEDIWFCIISSGFLVLVQVIGLYMRGF